MSGRGKGSRGVSSRIMEEENDRVYKVKIDGDKQSNYLSYDEIMDQLVNGEDLHGDFEFDDISDTEIKIVGNQDDNELFAVTIKGNEDDIGRLSRTLEEIYNERMDEINEGDDE